VRGEWRVGIFALKDIKEGEEITFDYQFERKGQIKQVCYCGESNCRGYLGEKKKKEEKKSKAMSSSEKEAAAKKRQLARKKARTVEKQVSVTEDDARDTILRYVVTQNLTEDAKSFVKKRQIFLPRNIRSGQKKLARQIVLLQQARQLQLEDQKKLETPKSATTNGKSKSRM
jgi:septum formation inhibitor MinC